MITTTPVCACDSRTCGRRDPQRSVDFPGEVVAVCVSSLVDYSGWLKMRCTNAEHSDSEAWRLCATERVPGIYRGSFAALPAQ